MRKITTQAVNAFLNSQSFNSGNTSIKVHKDFTGLYLHNNLIAKKYSHDDIINKEYRGNICISTAGWNTNTTKERLRSIPGVRIETKKGQLYLNGKEWDGSWTTI